MEVNKMIIKYQLLQVRRQQLEKNGLLQLSEFLVKNDYKGFDKHLHTWAEKHLLGDKRSKTKWTVFIKPVEIK